MRHHLLALTDAALAEELADLSGDVVRCDGPKAFPRDLGLRYASHDGYEFQVSTRQGEVLFHSDGLRRQGLRIPGPEVLAASPAFASRMVDRLGHARLAWKIVTVPSGPLIVQAAVSLAPNDRR